MASRPLAVPRGGAFFFESDEDERQELSTEEGAVGTIVESHGQLDREEEAPRDQQGAEAEEEDEGATGGAYEGKEEDAWRGDTPTPTSHPTPDLPACPPPCGDVISGSLPAISLLDKECVPSVPRAHSITAPPPSPTPLRPAPPRPDFRPRQPSLLAAPPPPPTYAAPSAPPLLGGSVSGLSRSDGATASTVLAIPPPSPAPPAPDSPTLTGFTPPTSLERFSLTEQHRVVGSPMLQRRPHQAHTRHTVDGSPTPRAGSGTYGTDRTSSPGAEATASAVISGKSALQRRVRPDPWTWNLSSTHLRRGGMSLITDTLIRGFSSQGGSESADVSPPPHAPLTASPLSLVRCLNLHDNAIGDVGTQLLCRALLHSTCSITSLSLACNGITHVGVSALSTALISSRSPLTTTLISLQLARNPFGDLGATSLAKAIRRHTAIQVLGLEETCIGAAGMLRVTTACCENVSLRKLCLSGNPIGAEGEEALVALVKVNRRLRALHLQSLSLHPDSIERIASNLVPAESSLSETPRRPSMDAAAQLSTSPASSILLQSFDSLQSSPCASLLTDSESSELAAAAHPLRSLVLDHNVIEAERQPVVLEAIASSLTNRFSALDFVSLSACGLEDGPTAAFIQALSSNCAVGTLVLSENKLGAATCEALGHLMSLNCCLHTLKLEHNLIRLAAIAPVATTLAGPCALEQIYLDGNKLKDEGCSLIADALLLNQSLRVLSLAAVSLSDSCGAKLLSAIATSPCPLYMLSLADNKAVGLRCSRQLCSLVTQKLSLEIIELKGCGVSERKTWVIQDELTVNKTIRTMWKERVSFSPECLIPPSVGLDELIRTRKLLRLNTVCAAALTPPRAQLLVNNLVKSSRMTLRVLDLHGSSLVVLPPSVCSIETLETLDVSFNQLHHLPYMLGHRKRLETIKVEGNSNLIIPPSHVVKQGTDAMKSFLVECLEGQQEGEGCGKRRLKLLVVGHGESGKTTIVNRLQWCRRHAIQRAFTSMPSTTSSVGIDMTSETELRISSDIYLNMWDFAGQLEYLATHQYFLSSAMSIYLLVVDLDNSLPEVERRATYWLEYLEAKLDPAAFAVSGHHQLRIILVGSKADEAARRPGHVEECRALLQRCGRLSSLRQIVAHEVAIVAAAKEGTSCDSLLELIHQSANSIVQGSNALPQYFHQVIEEIKSLVASGTSSATPSRRLFMSIKELASGSSVGMSDKLMAALEYLHNVGDVVLDVASKAVCLRPQILAKVMAVFVAPSEHLSELLGRPIGAEAVRNAILPRREAISRINAVLKHFNEDVLRTKSDEDHLLKVFERLNLCFLISPDEMRIYCCAEGVVFPSLRPKGSLFLLPKTKRRTSDRLIAESLVAVSKQTREKRTDLIRTSTDFDSCEDVAAASHEDAASLEERWVGREWAPKNACLPPECFSHVQIHLRPFLDIRYRIYSNGMLLQQTLQVERDGQTLQEQNVGLVVFLSKETSGGGVVRADGDYSYEAEQARHTDCEEGKRRVQWDRVQPSAWKGHATARIAAVVRGPSPHKLLKEVQRALNALCDKVLRGLSFRELHLCPICAQVPGQYVPLRTTNLTAARPDNIIRDPSCKHIEVQDMSRLSRDDDEHGAVDRALEGTDVGNEDEDVDADLMQAVNRARGTRDSISFKCTRGHSLGLGDVQAGAVDSTIEGGGARSDMWSPVLPREFFDPALEQKWEPIVQGDRQSSSGAEMTVLYPHEEHVPRRIEFERVQRMFRCFLGNAAANFYLEKVKFVNNPVLEASFIREYERLVTRSLAQFSEPKPLTNSRKLTAQAMGLAHPGSPGAARHTTTEAKKGRARSKSDLGVNSSPQHSKYWNWRWNVNDDDSTSERRQWIMHQLEKYVVRVSGNERVNLVAAWHGALEDTLHSIASNGPRIPAPLNPSYKISPGEDKGFYGNGLYFTQYPSCGEYYIRVGVKRREQRGMNIPVARPLLLSWLLMGDVYPVCEYPHEQYDIPLANTTNMHGQPCKPGYDSHYAVVKAPWYVPCEVGEQPDADEIAIFRREQVLPRYIVYYQRVLDPEKTRSVLLVAEIGDEAEWVHRLRERTAKLRESEIFVHHRAVADARTWVKRNYDVVRTLPQESFRFIMPLPRSDLLVKGGLDAMDAWNVSGDPLPPAVVVCAPPIAALVTSRAFFDAEKGWSVMEPEVEEDHREQPLEEPHNEAAVTTKPHQRDTSRARMSVSISKQQMTEIGSVLRQEG